jgi:hypothetical protein
MDASDFAAALDGYRQYLRKRQEAQQLRQEFDALQPPSSSTEADTDGTQADGSSAAQRDFSLKPGETLHIKLSPVSMGGFCVKSDHQWQKKASSRQRRRKTMALPFGNEPAMLGNIQQEGWSMVHRTLWWSRFQERVVARLKA